MLGLHSDPGGEIVNAPVGSKEWAKRWRLEIQHIRHNIPEEPKRFADFYFVGTKHRVWTLLNKPDGSTFKTFDEFCLAREPWGLSAAPSEVEQWLALVKGQKAARQETLPEARPGPGRGKRSERTEKEKIGNDCRSFSPRTEGQLRAINRAPEPIRQLYEQDKLSQVWAAKLGPKNPPPDEAARVAAIALELKGVPDKRTADGIVKRMLGAREPSRVDKIVALAKKASKTERRMAISRIMKLD